MVSLLLLLSVYSNCYLIMDSASGCNSEELIIAWGLRWRTETKEMHAFYCYRLTMDC